MAAQCLSSTSGCLLPANRLRSLAVVRLVARPPARRQQQQRRWRLPVAAHRGGNGSGGPRRQQSVPMDRLIKEYGLPALGLLLVGSLVGPLVGGLVVGALGLGVMIAAGAAALSISWLAVPLLVGLFGLPALMAGGMAAGVFATAAAGALLLPSLIQLLLIGGGLWLGTRFAQQLFYRGSETGSISPDGTIDVEGRTVDDDWRDEMFKEKQDRDAELREFDELLRRRDEFKRGRGPPYF